MKFVVTLYILLLLAVPYVNAELTPEQEAKFNKAIQDIYDNEHGARDKETIKMEYIKKGVLSGATIWCEEQLQNNNFENVILPMDTALDIALKDLDKYPKAVIPRDMLADAYLCKGSALFALVPQIRGRVDEAIFTLNKSISYNDSAEANFKLGLMYAMKGDFVSANKFTKRSVKLDSSYQSRYEEVYSQIIGPGLNLK